MLYLERFWRKSRKYRLPLSWKSKVRAFKAISTVNLQFCLEIAFFVQVQTSEQTFFNFLILEKSRFITLGSWSTFFKKNGPTPASFLFIFGLFKQAIHYLQQIVKKCPSSIQCWDPNPQPFEHELSPVTTRPGVPDQPFTLYRIRPSVVRWRQDERCQKEEEASAKRLEWWQSNRRHCRGRQRR